MMLTTRYRAVPALLPVLAQEHPLPATFEVWSDSSGLLHSIDHVGQGLTRARLTPDQIASSRGCDACGFSFGEYDTELELALNALVLTTQCDELVERLPRALEDSLSTSPEAGGDLATSVLLEQLSTALMWSRTFCVTLAERVEDLDDELLNSLLAVLERSRGSLRALAASDRVRASLTRQARAAINYEAVVEREMYLSFGERFVTERWIFSRIDLQIEAFRAVSTTQGEQVMLRLPGPVLAWIGSQYKVSYSNIAEPSEQDSPAVLETAIRLYQPGTDSSYSELQNAVLAARALV